MEVPIPRREAVYQRVWLGPHEAGSFSDNVATLRSVCPAYRVQSLQAVEPN